MTIIDALHRHAAERPGAPALTFEPPGEAPTRLSFAALLDEARAFAHGLAAAGVAPGDRVVLALGTSPALAGLILAAQSLRAAPMVVSATLPAAARSRRAAHAGARLTVDAARAADLRLALPGAPAAWARRPAPDDLAYLQLTSGTTGEPQAAAVTHAALSAYLEAARVHFDGAGDVIASWMPLHHDLGLVRFFFLPVAYGLHAILLPPALASLGPWLRAITAHRATVTGAPDFAYRLAARAVSPDGVDLRSLRIATNGGEPVRASTIQAFETRFGCPGAIRPGYGLAEATLAVTATPPGAPLVVDARGHVSCGELLPGVAARVTREGAVLPAGEPGDLEVRGAQLFAGYLAGGAPARLDRSAFTADGWLRTGDVGYLDAGGRLFVLGRARAMVKQAGALIAPREVEEAVDRVPGVRLSAAIGLPSGPDGAEELVVVVEPEGAPPPELTRAVLAAVREALGVSAGRVELVPPRTIPRTANGKIQHASLRAMLAPSVDP